VKSYLLFSIFIGFFSLFSTHSYSANLENGKNLYRTCSLCHGKVGQGVMGGDFPKIGGMPKYYILHQFDLFIEEKRFNPAMVTIGRLETLSDTEKDDLASYVASIDVEKEAPTLKIPTFTGDAEKGKKIYKDCYKCHGKKAEGKKKKKSPPTARQYSEYLLRQITFFKDKNRFHDNDEDDDTFEDYSEQEIIDVLTYISTLDD